MSQADATPPGGWVVRTDAGARKIVERIDSAVSRLDGRINSTDEDVAALTANTNRRIKARASKLWVTSFFLASGAALALFTLNSNSENRKELRDGISQVRQERAEDAKDLREAIIQVRVLKMVLVDKKSKAQAEAEAEKLTEEK